MKVSGGFNASDVLLSVLLLLVVSPFVLHAVPQFLGASQSFVVSSGSMEPAIDTGSVVWVYGTGSYTEGDVITFRSDTHPETGEPVYTTHRVVENNGESFVTKGDANEDPDPEPVQRSEVVGEVGFSAPLLGYAIIWAGSMQGLVALVILPATVLIMDELANVFREISGMRSRGEGMRMMQTLVVSVSGLVAVFSGIYILGLQQRLFATSFGISLGPNTFGIAVIVALLVSMLLLRFAPR